MLIRFTLAAVSIAVAVASCNVPGDQHDRTYLSHNTTGPECPLYLSDLDPNWGTVLIGNREKVPKTEVEVEDIAGFGTVTVETDAQVNHPGLRLQSAKVIFSTAATRPRLMFVALPRTGPYLLEVDGQVVTAPTFEGLAQANFANVRVDVFPQPLGSRRLYVAGDYTEVAIGGKDLYAYAGCGPFDHLLRPPYTMAYSPSPLDSAWYGVEIGTIGAADRVVDQFLVRGVVYSGLKHPVDKLSVAIAVWEVDPADPDQGTLVHEQTHNWYGVLPLSGGGGKTLPPQPFPNGMSLELPVSAGGLTMQSDKRYRVMASVGTTPARPGQGLKAGSRRFFSFPEDEGWFPDDSGDFEVLGTFREVQKVFPVTPMPLDPARPGELRFSLIGLETHAAP